MPRSIFCLSLFFSLSLSLHRVHEKLSWLRFIYGDSATAKPTQSPQKSNNGLQFKYNCFMHHCPRTPQSMRIYACAYIYMCVCYIYSRAAFCAALTCRKAVALANAAYAPCVPLARSLHQTQQQQQ